MIQLSWGDILKEMDSIFSHLPDSEINVVTVNQLCGGLFFLTQRPVKIAPFPD